jgi:hypothetical protein
VIKIAKKFVKTIFIKLLEVSGTYSLYMIRTRGPIKDAGWFGSFRRKESIDNNGQPIPWFTYPAIDFLAKYDFSDCKIFEWGAGSSTKWWAKNASSVIACEHDVDWYRNVKNEELKNVQIMHVNLNDRARYENILDEISEKFDVIVIDGRRRVECAKSAAAYLSKRGVIIFDNSDRERYDEGLVFLRENGFRQIPFSGLVPGVCSKNETSIFYRDGNIFKL